MRHRLQIVFVGIVADGTSELRRQNLVHGKLQMTSFQLGAKLYTEIVQNNKEEWVSRWQKSVKDKYGVDNIALQTPTNPEPGCTSSAVPSTARTKRCLCTEETRISAGKTA